MSQQTPSSPPTGPRIAPVYQLKLTLLEVERPVWPRIKVSGGLTLERLHTVMRKAMGWQNVHLDVRGRRYGVPEPDEVGKKNPLTLERFEEFFRLLPARADSERSWSVERKEIETPEELLDIIDAKGREAADAIAALRKML